MQSRACTASMHPHNYYGIACKASYIDLGFYNYIIYRENAISVSYNYYVIANCYSSYHVLLLAV